MLLSPRSVYFLLWKLCTLIQWVQNFVKLHVQVTVVNQARISFLSLTQKAHLVTPLRVWKHFPDKTLLFAMFLSTGCCNDKTVEFWNLKPHYFNTLLTCSVRPDITILVDWAFKKILTVCWLLTKQCMWKWYGKSVHSMLQHWTLRTPRLGHKAVVCRVSVSVLPLLLPTKWPASCRHNSSINEHLCRHGSQPNVTTHL